MKNLSFVIVIFLTSTISKAQNMRYDTIRYAKEHYLERVALFKNESTQKGRVVFLGNSIIEFEDWKTLLKDSTVINRGIAGDNTFGVLDRLEDVISLQPGKLFIEIGINDISQNIPVEIVVKNIYTISKRVKAKSPKTKIYIFSILPTNDNVKDNYPDAYNKSAETNSVNRHLKQKAAEGGFTYLDLNSTIKDNNGKLDKIYADPDGLHLNSNGYQLLLKLLP